MSLDDSWTMVAEIGDAEKKQPFVFEMSGENLLITKLNGAWIAYTLRCPHRGAQMRVVDYDKTNGELACPLHGWLFDLAKEGAELHGYTDLLKYEMQIDSDQLFVHLS